jgi:hypothetical protein
VTTIFWVGERPGGHNPVANRSSAWDKHWSAHYGGYDTPEPAARRSYIPVRFGLNRFAVARIAAC